MLLASMSIALPWPVGRHKSGRSVLRGVTLMIEPIMYFAIGFLVASLLGL